MPEFQSRDIAQEAIRLCEEVHGNVNWELDTIFRESQSCYLYEKMGRGGLLCPIFYGGIWRVEVI